MIVLGGMGSITGSLLGAVVITVLPELLRTYPYDIVFLLVLIPVTVLLLRAIGRKRLPAFLNDGAGYYGFVLVIYLVLFAVARLVLINTLDLDLRLQAVIGDIANYRLVIYAALLIGMMLTRPQGLLGGREFGLNWLKRAQRRPEGDEAVGASKGVPIAERGDLSEDKAKEVENR
jgi:ABC-type branched-subunit amino acid transport system permease subunit